MAKPAHSSIMIRRCAVPFYFLLLAVFARADAAPSNYNTVVVDTVKTSIYVGSVTLTTTPFQRADGSFSADYRAKVFPYFFSNEHGHLSIGFSDDELARLAKGETIYFKGRAENSDKEERRIEGRAVPASATEGKIKVRVFVTPKIELIFNTTYRFQ